METVRGWTDRHLGKFAGIIARGERLFKKRHPRSLALICGAQAVLAGGTTSGRRISRALRR